MKKLKITAVLLFLLLIVTITLYFFKPNNNSTGKVLDNNIIDDDYTQYVLEFESSDSGRIMRDYTNPTSDEKMLAYERFGYENVEFTSQGLLVKQGDYGIIGDRLYTNIWPDTEITSKITKPEVGKIDLVEVGTNYVTITLKNITKSETEQYISEIKSEYSHKEKKNNKTVLYLARNDDDVLVQVKFNGNLCTIKYSDF